MFASIVLNAKRQEDGFTIHPSVAQSGIQETRGGHLLSSSAAAIKAVCLDARSGKLTAAAWHRSRTNATLSSNDCIVPPKGRTMHSYRNGHSKLTLHGLSFHLPSTLESVDRPATNVFSLPDTTYKMKWTTEGCSQQIAHAAVTGSKTDLLHSRHLNPLQLSQAATLAAANTIQMLQTRQNVLMENIALLSFGSVSVHTQPARGLPASDAAAVQGIMKNLPFEMPSLTGAVLDLDPHMHASSNAYMLSAVSLPATSQADLYGAAVRSELILKPAIEYAASRASNSNQSDNTAIDFDRTYVVTGGLGGLGSMTGHWLCRAGAGALVLPGRTGTMSQATHINFSSQQLTAQVQLFKCDVSVSEDAMLLANVAEMDPKRFGGVCHAAGLQVNM